MDYKKENAANKKCLRLAHVYRGKKGQPIQFNRKPKQKSFTEQKRNASGYADKLKKRFTLIALLLLSLSSQAQFITVPEDDINTQFGLFVDPTFTDAGYQIGIFATMVMNWGYIGVSASDYDGLGGVGYTDLVGELGLNGHFGGFEPIRAYAGFRLGYLWRGSNMFPLVGGVVGFDWRVSKHDAEVDVYLGFKLWTDYRADQTKQFFGDYDAYERGLITNNPLLQENGAFLISFSF